MGQPLKTFNSIPKIAALLLAAGASRRMNAPKLFLPLDSKPIIRHCLDAIINAGIIDIILVARGLDRERLRREIDPIVKVVFNRNSASEMADSARLGLKAVDQATTGLIVCLVDHPLVATRTLQILMQQHVAMPDKVLIPTFDGRKGHPTLFPVSIIHELFNISAASQPTLRDLIYKHPARVTFIPVEDAGILLDMDTKKDYERVCQAYTKGRRVYIH